LSLLLLFTGGPTEGPPAPPPATGDVSAPMGTVASRRRVQEWMDRQLDDDDLAAIAASLLL